MKHTRRLSNEDIKSFLKDSEIDCVVDSEGRLFTVFPADEDFPHDVVFHFICAEDGWFGIEAVADGFDIEANNTDRAIAWVNGFNMRARLPKVVFKNNRFKIDQWIILSENSDDSYIKEYMDMVLAMSWHFFVDTKKQSGL